MLKQWRHLVKIADYMAKEATAEYILSKSGGNSVFEKLEKLRQEAIKQ
jgi:hypothetical protein